MTNFFHFLQEASQDKNLATFRTESQTENDDDEFADDDQARKPPKRMFSESLKEMIGKHDPDYACDPFRSDLYCLKNYIEANIPNFDYNNTENFKKQLGQLVAIVTSLTLSSTSYMRGTFVFITGFFRGYWLPKGDAKSKPILDIVGELVHAPEELVKMYLDQKATRLRSRHRDKFDVDFLELDHAVRSLVSLGGAGNTKKHGAAWALAIEVCCGARKIEILDPNIQFMTLNEYHAKQEFAIIKLGDPSADFLQFRADRADDELLSHIIVQVGWAKDKAQFHNTHYEKAGQLDKIVQGKPLIKTTIFYNAKFIVDLIASFREKFELTKETFTGRRTVGNKWSTAVFRPLFEQFFPRIYQKAQRHGWQLGSHMGRKLYAATSYRVYAKSVRIASGETIGKQTWISIMLGHVGGLMTQLSYDVIEFLEDIQPQHLKMPTDEIVKELQREVQFYRDEVQENRNTMSSLLDKLASLEREMRKIKDQHNETKTESEAESKSAFQTFKLANGTHVTIQKAPKIKNRSAEDKKKLLDGLSQELKKQSLLVNTSNLRRLGVGSETANEYVRNLKNNTPREIPEQKQKQAPIEPVPSPPPTQVERVATQNNEQKQKTQKQHQTPDKNAKNKNTYTLKPGEKIISGDPNSTQAANKLRHHRDAETWGEENVLEHESDCEGQMTEERSVGYKKRRKLCNE